MLTDLFTVRSPSRLSRGRAAGWVSAVSALVTAEFATVIPAVMLVLACCLGGLQLAAQQLRLQDAAAALREAWPAARRRGGTARAAQLVAGATIARSDRGGMVCVAADASAARRIRPACRR